MDRRTKVDVQLLLALEGVSHFGQVKNDLLKTAGQGVCRADGECGIVRQPDHLRARSPVVLLHLPDAEGRRQRVQPPRPDIAPHGERLPRVVSSTIYSSDVLGQRMTDLKDNGGSHDPRSRQPWSRRGNNGTEHDDVGESRRVRQQYESDTIPWC